MLLAERDHVGSVKETMDKLVEGCYVDDWPTVGHRATPFQTDADEIVVISRLLLW